MVESRAIQPRPNVALLWPKKAIWVERLIPGSDVDVSHDLRTVRLAADLCGPCHREFPAVKLIHELYKESVVVIGVHNNSALPDAVREHAANVGLTFPIVIDHPDGRIVSRYQKHGLVPHYPSYVLIGPDGTVLLDDQTIAHPKLSSYKLEILRSYLFSKTPQQ